jgi:4-amino-4-deoxy-L-arabinose transferase-like glycosyltransferase
MRDKNIASTMDTMNSMKHKNWFCISIVVLIALYLISHLWNLTALPVFADESIYIRWSQLIIDDWKQYAFFPLNDGKTPLQMWVTIPFLLSFKDPLFAARLVSVLAGLLQVLIVGWTTLLLGGRKKTALLAMIFTTFLPFWFFHHRIALTDALLLLFSSAAIATTIKAQQLFSEKNVLRKPLLWSILSGILFGLAIWSKIPALLLVAALPLYVFSQKPKAKSKPSLNTYLLRLSLVSATILTGLVVFVSLKINPAFGQLFSRGNDFLFPWAEVVLEGKWTQTIQNIPSYIGYFTTYFTWPLLLLIFASLFGKRDKRVIFILVLSALSFFGPIALLGKVVYPRYFLPVVFYLTVAAAIAIEQIHDRFVTASNSMSTKVIISMILVFSIAHSLGMAGVFAFESIFEPAKTPFVTADKEQYLEEWSSGHGIKEVLAYLRQESQTQTLAVATEGRFGTLPDGLLMYLHRTDVSNLYIEGIGYPVTSFSEKYLERASEFDRQLLVVNSHRMQISTEGMRLELEVCRPNNAPCLQVWDVTNSPLLNSVAESPNSL